MSSGYDRECCFRRSILGGAPRVLFELNTACNLNCGFCHARPHSEPGLPIETIRAGMESLARLGIREIIFSGGEPLLRSDCMTILASAREIGLQLDLCTNAVLVTPEIARCLSENLTEISVSLDSADPSIHNRLRGRPSAWEKAVGGMRLMVEHGLEVHIITLVCDTTIPGIEETIRFLAGFGVHSVTLLGLVPTQDGSAYQLSEPMRARLVADLPGLRARYPQVVINTKRVTASASAGTCGAAKDIWGITALGELVPCILLQDCARGIPLPALSDFSTWEQVNAHLRKMNPGSFWNLCAAEIAGQD